MEQRNDKKLSDKAFIRLIATSLFGILLCVVCLCSSTWAWFTDSVPSGENVIQTAGECLLTVTVQKDGEQPLAVEDSLTVDCQGDYAVKLTLPKGSASGYLTVSVNDATYHSDFLKRNEELDQTASFTLRVATAQSVTFKIRWGMYSGEPEIPFDGVLTIS